MEASESHRLATSLKRKPVAYGTYPPLEQALGTSEFRRVLVLERARTDRSEQEFSLLLLQGGALCSRGVSGRVIRELSENLRATDNIGWFDHRRLAVLLPCTPL